MTDNHKIIMTSEHKAALEKTHGLDLTGMVVVVDELPKDTRTPQLFAVDVPDIEFFLGNLSDNAISTTKESNHGWYNKFNKQKKNKHFKGV